MFSSSRYFIICLLLWSFNCLGQGLFTLPKFKSNPIIDTVYSCNIEHFHKKLVYNDTIFWFDDVSRYLIWTDNHLNKIDSLYLSRENKSPYYPEAIYRNMDYLIISDYKTIQFFEIKSKKSVFCYQNNKMDLQTLIVADGLTALDKKYNGYALQMKNNKIVCEKLFKIAIFDVKYLSNFFYPIVYFKKFDSNHFIQSYASSPQITVYDSSGVISSVFANPFSGFITQGQKPDRIWNGCNTYSYGPIMQWNDSMYYQLTMRPNEKVTGYSENWLSNRACFYVFYDKNFNYVGKIEFDNNEQLFLNRLYKFTNQSAGIRVQVFKNE